MPVSNSSAPDGAGGATVDPRTKLFVAIAAIAAVVLLDSVVELASAYGSVLVLILLAKAGREYLRWLRVLTIMLSVLFVIVWLTVGPPAALAAALRLLTLTSIFFVFFTLTRPEDLADALVQSGLPYRAAFVVRAALQFVPVLSRTAAEVFDAQRARGIPIDRGVRALLHYPALLAPLLVQSFRLADYLAEAMESRGFGREGRSFLNFYRLRPVDWLLGTGALLGLAAVVVML